MCRARFTKKFLERVTAYQVEIPTEILRKKAAAKPGDWVITGRDGDQVVVSNADFRDHYIPISPSAYAALASKETT